MEEQREPNVGWTEALGEHASNPPNPRTSGWQVTSLGSVWTVPSCEDRLKAQFEQWVRGNYKKILAEIEETMGPDEADMTRRAFIADFNAGHYNFDGRHCRSAMKDIPGMHYFLFILLRRCHPQITLSQVEKLFADNPKDFSEAARWALGNSPAPVQAGGNGKVLQGDIGSQPMVKTTPKKVMREEPVTLDSNT